MSDTVSHWPAYHYGPDGQHAVFLSEDEVPEGWQDHPSKVADAKSAAKKPVEPPKESPYKEMTDAEVIAELKKRKLEFNDKWPRHKLETSLLDDDKKGK